MVRTTLFWLLLTARAVSAANIDFLRRDTNHHPNATLPLSKCPGYKASNVKTTGSTLFADLTLAGPACNTYGTDLKGLSLKVVYETGWQDTYQDYYSC